MRKITIRPVFYLTLIAFMAFIVYGRSIWVPAYQKINGRRTVAEVIAKYGAKAEKRLLPYFQEAGIEYPPEKITLIALKEEKELELWAFDSSRWLNVKTYDILGASGKAGPKLRQGDLQVPEGIYDIVGLNPNSSYHLSMKLNYPNAYDQAQAKKENRSNLGGDIFIHGKTGSVGCLAMGDPAIEELFTVVEKVGRAGTKVIISPKDSRKAKLYLPEDSPVWLADLYAQIENALESYKMMSHKAL